MLLFAVALTLNPHPDLWLDDATFARKYCPDDLDALAWNVLELSDLRSRIVEAGPPAVTSFLHVVRELEENATTAAGHVEAEVGRWRNRLRADPAFRLPAPLGPATSGGP